MKRMLNHVVVILAVVLAAGPSWAQSTAGSWAHFPPQTPTFNSVIRPPIKADGSSTFQNGSVVPVKFKLLTGPGVFSFDSVVVEQRPDPGERRRAR